MDNKLQLIDLQLLQEGAFCEHFCLSQVDPLAIQVDYLLKGLSLYHSHNCVRSSRFRHQRSFSSMHELSFTEAHALAEDIDFFSLTVFLGHAE